MRSEIPDKDLFKIGEVASILGVKPHIIRYWASEFPQIRLKKTRSGQRVFRRHDIEVLQAVSVLIHVHQFTVAGARDRLKEFKRAEIAPSEQCVVAEHLVGDDALQCIMGGGALGLKPTGSPATEPRASDTHSTKDQATIADTPVQDDIAVAKQERDDARAALLAARQEIDALTTALNKMTESIQAQDASHQQTVRTLQLTVETAQKRAQNIEDQRHIDAQKARQAAQLRVARLARVRTLATRLAKRTQAYREEMEMCDGSD